MTNGIGPAISRARVRKGYSQKQLAQLCGITPTYMSQIEGGKKVPSYSLVEKLCQGLGIKQQDIYRTMFLDSFVNENPESDKAEFISILREMLDRLTVSTDRKEPVLHEENC